MEEPEEELPMQPMEEDEEARSEKTAALPEQLALPYSPGRTLDPIVCADGMQQVVASLLYEGLFRLNGQMEPEPCLCGSYSKDEESRRYVFELREGVVFSDGSPLTAKDVRMSLDRARQSPRYQSRLSGITSVSVSRGKVVVTLSSPNTALPALLDVPIMKSGTQNTAAPTGTGPYLYEEAGSCLVANQSWWRGANQAMDRITLVEAADQDTLLYRFSSHDVQVITADLTGTSPVSTTGRIDCLDADTTILQYLGCNTVNGPLANAAVRRALWRGVHREYLVNAFLSGHGRPAQFPVSPASPLYPASLEMEYSLEAFTQALTASGYTPEAPLILLVNEENSFKKAIADYLAESFTTVGLTIEVRSLPWVEYTAALAAGNFDLYYGEVRLSADWRLTSLLGTGGSLNYGRWTNPQTDQLIAALGASEDRAAAMQALCAHLLTEAPILPLCFKSTSVLSQAGVLEGLTPTAAEPFYNLESFTVHLRGENAS